MDDICSKKQVQYYNDHFQEDYGTDKPLSLFWKEYADHWSNQCGSQEDKKVAIIDVKANEEQGMDYWYNQFGDRKQCNNTKTFLFEPNPVNVKRIKEKITKNGNNKYSNFVLVEAAVSNFTGKATFRTKHENNPGNQHGALNSNIKT